jgi:CrcB protein
MIWLVALGGALGSVSRFLLGPAIQRALGFTYPFGTFPFGTLFINVAGSLIVGIVAGLATDGGTLSPEARTFLAIGFCGGFTTFSTFGLETVVLLEAGQVGRAGAYIIASVALSVTAAFLGLLAARQFLSR